MHLSSAMSGKAQAYFITCWNVDCKTEKKIETWERYILFLNNRVLRLTNDGRTYKAANNNYPFTPKRIMASFSHKSVL